MLPGFAAEESLICNKSSYASSFDTLSNDNIIPFIRSCPPCGPCVGGTKTCWHYIPGDDACDSYEVSCNGGGGGDGLNCCGKKKGYPCP
jgi:hypothetical protein